MPSQEAVWLPLYADNSVTPFGIVFLSRHDSARSILRASGFFTGLPSVRMLAMQNIEIKARLDDSSRVERQLEALGARRMWRRWQQDTFYKVPQLGAMPSWLKLREAEDSPPEVIGYCRAPPHGGPHASDYEIIIVKEAEAWKRLFGRVLPDDKVVKKTRTLWLYENTRIHLDSVDDLGEFIELETVVNGPPDSARAETLRIMEILHLDESDCIQGAYRDLLPD